jgi:hypothetical protein
MGQLMIARAPVRSQLRAELLRCGNRIKAFGPQSFVIKRVGDQGEEKLGPVHRMNDLTALFSNMAAEQGATGTVLLGAEPQGMCLSCNCPLAAARGTIF